MSTCPPLSPISYTRRMSSMSFRYVQTPHFLKNQSLYRIGFTKRVFTKRVRPCGLCGIGIAIEARTSLSLEHPTWLKDFHGKLRARWQFLKLEKRGGMIFQCRDAPHLSPGSARRRGCGGRSSTLLKAFLNANLVLHLGECAMPGAQKRATAG